MEGTIEFHEKLQELRKSCGLTQDELAELLYVSCTAISKRESGRGYPSIDSLKAISAYFSVSLDNLLSGEASMEWIYCPICGEKRSKNRYDAVL